MTSVEAVALGVGTVSIHTHHVLALSSYSNQRMNIHFLWCYGPTGLLFLVKALEWPSDKGLVCVIRKGVQGHVVLNDEIRLKTFPACSLPMGVKISCRGILRQSNTRNRLSLSNSFYARLLPNCLRFCNEKVENHILVVWSYF